MKKYGYIIKAEIVSDDNIVKEAFTAYTYPGLVPGNAFGFNNHGLLITCNAVFPKRCNQSSLREYWYNGL